MRTYYEFQTAQEARAYRHKHGTGGWIFATDNDGAAILFPWAMTANQICGHPLTRGQSGQLIGCEPESK